MLYEKLKKAWEQADVDAYKALHHEDFTFTFHSTGRVMTRNDMTCLLYTSPSPRD